MILGAGVVGGLLAPLPSGAQTTPQPPSIVSVTLSVDGASSVSILGNLKTCPSTQFNWCYDLAKGTLPNGTPVLSSATGPATTSTRKQRKFTIVQNAAAQLLIADFKNTNSIRLNGFKVVPLVDGTTLGSGWTTSSPAEAHTATITVQVKFNSFGNRGQTCSTSTPCVSNKDDDGNIAVGFAGGGQFVPNPFCGTTTCSPSNTVQSDRTDISVKGDFSPTKLGVVVYNSFQDVVPTDTAQTIKPRYWHEKTAILTGTQYSLYDRSTIPVTDCRESNTTSDPLYQTCAPIVTFTHSYQFYGPDELKVTSTDGVEAWKSDLCFKPQGPPTNNPNNPCKNRSGKKTTNTDEALGDALFTFHGNEVDTGQNEGFGIGEQCGVDNPACRCSGAACKASYIHIVRATPEDVAEYQTFTFFGTGPGIGDGSTPHPYTIQVLKVQTSPGVYDTFGKFEWQDLPTFAGAWEFEVGPYPLHPVEGKRWDLDNLGCTSKLYGTLATKTSDFTHWTQPSGSVKTGHDVLALQGGTAGGADELTCIWHIHTKALR